MPTISDKCTDFTAKQKPYFYTFFKQMLKTIGENYTYMVKINIQYEAIVN